MNQIEITLHYYLEDKDLHQMDAFVHNYCEWYLLMALEHLFLYDEKRHEKYVFDVRVPKEGGFISDLIVQNIDVANTVLGTLLGAFCTYFFSKMTNRTTDIANRLEIIEKIKKDIVDGTLTQDDALELVANDKLLKKYVSSFYKKLEKEKRAVGFEISYQMPYENPHYFYLDVDDNDRITSQRIFKFRINEDYYYSMRAVVKRCFELFIEKNPQMTADDIVSVWSTLNIDVQHLVENEELHNKRLSRSTESFYNFEKRHYMLELKNGEYIYITNQYTFSSFLSFMEKVNSQNWGINIDYI